MSVMYRMAAGMILAIACGISGCTHVKGVVLEDQTNRPCRSAVLSIGRPDAIAVYARHTVDRQGQFDFYMSPTDESNLYLYDGAADALMTMRRIDRTEIGEHMRLVLHRAAGAGDSGVGIESGK